MHIPTAFGHTLAHPVCNWLCTGDVHALTLLGSRASTTDEVRDNATQLGLDVVEVLPAREMDITTLQRHGKQFDGHSIARRPARDQTKGWILRCRVPDTEGD